MTVFDLTIAADRLAPLPLNWTVEADAAQRATVRDIAGILDCSMLKAAATFRPVKRGTGGFCIPLEIHLRADIVQACGVTLDPVPETIDETYVFEVHTQPPRTPPSDSLDPADLMDAPDIIDMSDTQVLDLGALIEEAFYLSINPYPRSVERADGDQPAVVFSDEPEAADGGNATSTAAPEGTRRPFAGLADMLREKSAKSG